MADKWTQLPNRLDLAYVPGDLVTLAIELADDTGPVNLAGQTIVAEVHAYGDDTSVLATFTTVLSATVGTVHLTLPAATTAALGHARMSWVCRNVTLQRTWFAGDLEPHAATDT